MYGYVRPVREELKVREYELYRGVYCGLCHTLKRRYGPLYRFAVSYDLTFLAMLLAPAGPAKACPKRCPYRPARKTSCPEASDTMDRAADITVVLAYEKILDGVRDRGFFGRTGCRLLAAILRPGYKKARERVPVFSETAERELRALTRLEEEKTPCLDAAADTFAQLLSAAAEGEEEAGARVLRQLLYHLGRIIYILDAADDLAEDLKTGAYNPLRYRFELREGRLSEEDEQALRLSLTHSQNAVIAAYQLLDRNPYAGILDNIIYYGLPAAAQAVFDGTWRASHSRRGRNRL